MSSKAMHPLALLSFLFVLSLCFTPAQANAERSDSQNRPSLNAPTPQLAYYYYRHHHRHYRYYGPRHYRYRYYGPRRYYRTYWGLRRYYRGGCYTRCKYNRYGRAIRCIRRCR